VLSQQGNYFFYLAFAVDNRNESVENLAAEKVSFVFGARNKCVPGTLENKTGANFWSLHHGRAKSLLMTKGMLYDPNMLQPKPLGEVYVADAQTTSTTSENEQKKVTSGARGEANVRSVDGPRFQPFVACSQEWSVLLEPDANIAVSEVELPDETTGTVLALESRSGQDLEVDVDIAEHVATFGVAKTAQPYKKWIIRLAPGISTAWTSKPVTLRLQAPTVEQQIVSFEREIPQCDIKFFSTAPAAQQSRSEIDGLPHTEF
jgi:hypothetical protein